MARNRIEKEIKRLNKILESDFLYKDNLQVLGKFLFDNLPEVEGIEKQTRKTYESGEEAFEPVIMVNKEAVIYEDGKILTRLGAEYVKDTRTLYRLLDSINDTLETTDQLAKDIKKALMTLKKR